jgi:hypothetical protein
MQDVRYASDRIASGSVAIIRYIEPMPNVSRRSISNRTSRGHTYEDLSVEPSALERQQHTHHEFDPTREAFVNASGQVVGPKLD